MHRQDQCKHQNFTNTLMWGLAMYKDTRFDIYCYTDVQAISDLWCYDMEPCICIDIQKSK